MKKIIETIKSQQIFIIVAIVIGFFINRTNCIPDPNCDPDPLYGACDSGCEFGTISQWAIKSFGIWIVLSLGAFTLTNELHEKQKLKKFLEIEGLKYIVRQIDEEWIVQEKIDKKDSNKLMKKINKIVKANSLPKA